MADTQWNSDPGAVGSAMPIVPSVPQDFINDYKSAMYGNAFIKQQGGGLFPGLIRLLAGINPAEIAAAYNGTLTGAQGAEQGRLKTSYYDQANGVGQPQQPQYAPPQAPVGPDPGQGLIAALSGGASGGVPAAQPAGGIVQSLASGAPLGPPPGAKLTAPPISGGFGPSRLQQQLATAYRIPGFESSIGPLVSAIAKQQELGTQFAPDGSLTQIPGFLGTTTNTALAKDHIAPVGNPLDPRAVNSAVAGQAGSKRGAEATAQNVSDLRYRPAIAGLSADAETLAKNQQYRDPQGVIRNQDGSVDAAASKAGTVGYQKDAAENLAKWLGPNMLRPSSDLVNPAALPGSPALPPMTFGGGPSGMLASGGAPAPNLPPGVIARNTPEYNQRSTDLGKQTTALDDAVTSARLGNNQLDQMLGQIGTMHTGPGHEQETEIKNFLTQRAGIDFLKGPVTSDQIFDKLAIQLSSGAMAALGKGEAASVLDTFRKAFPNREMTPDALHEMIASLHGVNDYVIAQQTARADWIKGHMTAEGFNNSDWFKENPPMRFAVKYLSLQQLKDLKARGIGGG